MCGIAGQVDFRRQASPAQVAELVGKIQHRGPDAQGIWSSPGGECSLGHARLSIIDLSPLGHQPMFDPETGNCIVFNGEIYNFQDLRKECAASGDKFRSHSDTEIILVLYRRYGVACLEKLRGMFAFALWDEKNKRMFLARDRVGKKPLNYALTDGGLILCSEIDPLSQHPLVAREMDREALELYLQLQYVPAPWTIYKGIRKLPPAHYGVFDKNGLQLKQYWDIDYTKKVSVSEGDVLDALEEKLTEAVRLRMISDVPLGALLSGGVDSSLVVALMAKLSGEPTRTFSMGFREEAFNELGFAQQAAERCGTLHHAEILEGDVAELLPQLAKHYGEPYADSSAVPSFLVCRAARRHVTVAMNGDGGDELLGGYPRYWLSPTALRLAPWFSDFMSPERASALAAQMATVNSLPGRAVRKVLTDYIRPELKSVSMYSDFWNDRERAELMDGHGHKDLLSSWRAQWFAAACERAENPVDRMLWYDNRTYLAGDLLVKMDIAAMHCGLETRSPLLDHKVIEYCAALPVKFKVKNRVGKSLLKQLAERYFPASFVYRRKMGFAIPLGNWLRGPLYGTLKEVLDDPQTMWPLNRQSIEQVLGSLQAGDDYHDSRLWTLLMYGLWRRHAGLTN